MSLRKTILIDFEEAFDSFTGIPLSTINDALCIIKSDNEVILWYWDKRKTEKIEEWMNSFFKQDEMARIHLLKTRPSNFKMWLAQICPIFPKQKIPCDFAYSRLFPKLPIVGNKYNLLRIDDPFGRDSNALTNFFLEISCGVKIKNALARSIRTLGYSKMGLERTIRIFNSNYTKDVWHQIYQDSNLKDFVVYPPVQFSIEDTYLKMHVQAQKTKIAKHFVFIGGQRQRKDPAAIIKAWAKRLHQFSFDFVVVGSIDDMFFTSEMKTASSLGRLRMVKNISSQNLRELIETSQGIIFNSKGEGFGNPIAEGMYLGVPVICNDLEVFKEVGKGYAHFFRSGDYSNALDILQNLASGQLRHTNERETYYGVKSTIKVWKELLNHQI